MSGDKGDRSDEPATCVVEDGLEMDESTESSYESL